MKTTIKHEGVSIKENSWLARIAAMKLGATQVAMVLGNTIHLYGSSAREFLSNKSWLQHELCHIAQFKRYGFWGFISRYLWESLKHGYYRNRFEAEARDAELAEKS